MFSSGCAKTDQNCARKESCSMSPMWVGTHPLNNWKFPYLLHNIALKTLNVNGSLLCYTLTLVNEFCCDLHGTFFFWEHPAECLSALGAWSASHQKVPDMDMSCWGDIQTAPEISRHQLVQDDCVMVFPVSQHACVATAASVQFSAIEQQPEEARLNTRGTFIFIVQVEKTYRVTGCPSFLLKLMLTSTKSTLV